MLCSVSCYEDNYINHVRTYRNISQQLMFCSWCLKDSNGNLELAVAFLTAKNAKPAPPEETAYYQTALPGNDRYISVGSQADASKLPRLLRASGSGGEGGLRNGFVEAEGKDRKRTTLKLGAFQCIEKSASFFPAYVLF